MSYGELRGAASLIWSVTGEYKFSCAEARCNSICLCASDLPGNRFHLQHYPAFNASRSVAEALKEENRTTGKAGAKSPLQALSWWAR